MKRISVRLDDAEFAALSRLSEQLGETRSQVVKRGIASFAKQKLRGASANELAEKLGLIGSFKRHADLSETVAVRIRRKLNAEAALRR